MSFLKRKKSTISFPDYLKDDTGVAAVEFALVGPPFLFVLLAMFETGIMLFTEYAMQAGVQEAARIIRTGQAQNSPMNWTAAKFKSYVCEKATVIPSCNTKVSVYVRSLSGNFASLKATIPANPLAVGPATPGGSPTTVYAHGCSQSFSAIYVTLDWDFAMPFMNVMSNVGPGTRRIVASTIFQNEPFNAPIGPC
jgi:Flp pilus assembly protein TadG